MFKKILLLLLLPLACFAEAMPKQLAVPGGIVQLPLLEAMNPAPTAYFQGKRVMVVKDRGWWVAVIGIPLDAKLGRHKISTKVLGKDMKLPFDIKNKEYPAQYLTIQNKRMVNPNAEDLKKIKADRVKIGKALAVWTEQAVLDLDFMAPVDGRLSSRFGLKRFFNKQPRNPHSGLDIAAPAGTAIKAPAAARVIDTGNYYYNGNTVFLDHGQGLISGYFHMSKIGVEPGQLVKQGDMLGTVGSTGRVTGPHLHWNVYLNGTKVDPALFIAKDIPRLDARNRVKKKKTKK